MDMQQIMKQAQEMQQKMQDLQERLTNTNFEGSAGGGLVKVTINGRGQLLKVDINPDLFTTYPDIVKDPKILEDLIIAAFNDALNKRDEESNNSFKNMMGALGLPNDFNMPL